MKHQFTSAPFSGSARAAVPAQSTPPVPAPSCAGTVVNKSARPAVGGIERPTARHGAVRGTSGADSLLPPMPAQSIFRVTDTPLPRGQFTQAALDVLAVIAAFLFVSVSGLAIAVSFFILLMIHL